MKRLTLLTALTLLLAAHVTLGQSRRGGPDPAEWAPEEPLFFFGVTDTERLWNDFQKTSGYQMLQDQEATEASGMGFNVGDITKKLKAWLSTLLGVAESDLKNPFAGPFVMYVTAPPGAGPDDMQMALIAGVGDQATMRQYTDKLIERLKEAADNYDSASAGSNTIHVFESESPAEDQKQEEDEFDFDADPSPMGPGFPFKIDQEIDEFFALQDLPPELAMCLTDDRLIVASNAEQVRAHLASGRSGRTLYESDDYQALLRLMRPLGETRFLFNLPRVFEMARREASSADEFSQWFGMLGGGSLRSVVGHMRLGARSYDSKLELFFLMTGERSGLAALLSMDNREIAPPPWTAAGVAAYINLNIDPQKLLNEILNMASKSNPNADAMIRATLENGPPGPDGQPINFRTDLINHLSGPLTASVQFTQPFGAESLRGLVTIGHRNREAITRILTMFGGGQQPRDVRGTPVYQTPFGTFAVSSDRVYYGNQAGVEVALGASAADSLAASSKFSEVERLVPEKAWGIFYIDEHTMTKAMIEMARKSGELMSNPASASWMMPLQMSGSLPQDPDKAEKALKYSGTSIITIASTPDGVRMTMVELKPPTDK